MLLLSPPPPKRQTLQVYSPLELLLFIAGCCTIADSFVPQLVNVPKATVNSVVRAVLSMSFVIGASVVVYNLKSRFCKEQAWNVSGGASMLPGMVVVWGEDDDFGAGFVGGRGSIGFLVAVREQEGKSLWNLSWRALTPPFLLSDGRLTGGGPCLALWRCLDGQTMERSALGTPPPPPPA